MLLAQLHHYGFFGIDGLIGLIVGLLVFVVLAAILWHLFKAVMAAVGVPAPWNEVIYWLVVLLIFLMFCHFFGFF